jgi:hypothetical protein
MTGEPVLGTDYRGLTRARREVTENWDVEELRRRQEAFVSSLRPVEPGGWTTASRDEQGVMRFWSEDF